MTLGPWHTPAIIENVEAQLNRAFMEILFRPVIAIIRGASRQGERLERLNASMDPLHEALRSGQVQYDTAAGEFSGHFSAAISRPLQEIGATFDKRKKVFKIRPERVPAWILADAHVYRVTAEEAHKAMTRVLAGVQSSLDDLADKYAVDPAAVVHGVATGYKAVGEALGISAELAPESMAKISREYTDNLKLRVRTFTNKEVGELRDLVQENAVAGHRFDRLITRLEGRYEVSRNKAKFLAQNETSLFMATHREARFAEVGIVEYGWSTSLDERVRNHPKGPNHEYLHGKTFRYDDPPVVDLATGRRANPGKDYNCRCTDKPKLPSVRQRLKQEAA